MKAPAPPAPPDLDDRYGAPRPGRRRALIAACAGVVLAFGGWLTWTIVDQSTPAVRSELETYSITGERAATAVVVVTLADSTVEASCKVRAYAEDHTVVGEINFTPDAATRRQTQEIRTERQATSVESMGCTAPGQNRPR